MGLQTWTAPSRHLALSPLVFPHINIPFIQLITGYIFAGKRDINSLCPKFCLPCWRYSPIFLADVQPIVIRRLWRGRVTDAAAPTLTRVHALSNGQRVCQWNLRGMPTGNVPGKGRSVGDVPAMPRRDIYSDDRITVKSFVFRLAVSFLMRYF